MHFRILKMIATSSFLTALDAPNSISAGLCAGPAGGVYSAFPDTLAGLRGPNSKGRGRKGGEGG